MAQGYKFMKLNDETVSSNQTIVVDMRDSIDVLRIRKVGKDNYELVLENTHSIKPVTRGQNAVNLNVMKEILNESNKMSMENRLRCFYETFMLLSGFAYEEISIYINSFATKIYDNILVNVLIAILMVIFTVKLLVIDPVIFVISAITKRIKNTYRNTVKFIKEAIKMGSTCISMTKTTKTYKTVKTYYRNTYELFYTTYILMWLILISTIKMIKGMPRRIRRSIHYISMNRQYVIYMSKAAIFKCIYYLLIAIENILTQLILRIATISNVVILILLHYIIIQYHVMKSLISHIQ